MPADLDFPDALTIVIESMFPALPPAGVAALRAEKLALAERQGLARFRAFGRTIGTSALISVRPTAPGGRAAILGWAGAGVASLVDEACEELTKAGAATAVVLGGPPGNYLASGVDLDDEELAGALVALGFEAGTQNLELTLETPLESAEFAAVSERELPSTLAWIRDAFLPAWSFEAQTAASHGALWALRDGEIPRGFVAHSGNNAPLGTFGPLGVDPASRGTGLGQQLCKLALADLGRRGFRVARVPWVSPERRGFYARCGRIVSARSFAMFQRVLRP